MKETTFVVVLVGIFMTAITTDVFGDCFDQWDACTERGTLQGERCWDSCDSRYPNNYNAWERCTDRCDASEDSAWKSCEREEKACEANATRESSSALYGSRESGQDGCYFGECPGDINTAPSGSPPQTVPQPQPPNPQPQTRAQTTSICQTPTFWCTMLGRGPVGMSCYCNTLYGPLPGITVPER